MKSKLYKLPGIAPFSCSPFLVVFSKSRKLAYIFIAFAAISTSSCYLSFFSTNTNTAVKESNITKSKEENKFFIIHFPDTAFALKNISLSNDTIHGVLAALPTEHSKYLRPGSFDKNRFKKSDRNYVLTETHLYTNATRTADSVFSGALSSFVRSDVYGYNKSATTKNHIWSTVGIVLTTAFVAGIITAAAVGGNSAPQPTGGNCNCPQVFICENGNYNFTSGLYSGAVYSTLERMDYLPINVPADSSHITFKIANPKSEEQFINKVELLQVNHYPDVNILADRHGKILSYKNIQPAFTAFINDSTDAKNILHNTDDRYYSFNSSANKNGFSDITLSFKKPADADKAKLVIHARNTYWGGLLHKEFISYFGDSYDNWRKKQETGDSKQQEQWQTEQALPLMVYVKTQSGWKFIDFFQVVGNTASRDMIMEINTTGIEGDTLQLKLETAYRFWDLDLAGVDYSSDDDINVAVITPETILKSDGADERTVLSKNDTAYTHLANNEFISLQYALPASAENKVSSYLLSSGGYYHTLETAAGKVNYQELYKFRQPGAFDKFSREKYLELQQAAAFFSGAGNAAQ